MKSKRPPLLRPVCGRIEYDVRRSVVFFERLPLTDLDLDHLTSDERSALYAMKATPTEFGEWRVAA